MKKSTKVYLEAARAIAENEKSYSCWAVAEVESPRKLDTHYRYSPLPRRYMDVFSPDGTFDTFTIAVRSIGDYVIRADWRVLALCFMATIEESGGLE